MIIEILIGFALAAISILAVRAIFKQKDHAFWRQGLILAALVYVGFALCLGGTGNWIGIELGGVVLYGVIAYMAKGRRYAILALGWGLHILWDVLLHSGGHPTYVPHWYPGVCIGFDIAIALYIGSKLLNTSTSQTVSPS